MARLVEEIDQVQTYLGENLPSNVLEAFAAEQNELDGVVPEIAIAVGDVLPDGNLVDVEGSTLALSEIRNGQATLVVVYRGGWCPFCSATLRNYANHIAEPLAARGVKIVAVSPQALEPMTAQSADLPFAFYSDPSAAYAKSLGLGYELPAEVAEAQRQINLDIRELNADGSTDIVKPSVVLVDADGVIRFISVSPNYASRPEADEILAAVEEL